MEGKKEVHMEDFEHAKDKILMGAERKSAVIDEQNRKRIAFHEGGHALVAMYTPGLNSFISLSLFFFFLNIVEILFVYFF